jgi:hypothetical protein
MLVSSERLYSELWTSFASLLRAYTAAHGLSKQRIAQVEVSEGAILVRIEQRWLRIQHEGASGQWEREDGRSGTLQMNESGQIRLNDAEFEEMDLVAEELARELMR